ncbi:MAG: GNAT family N-acetyltransferase [Acidimicrobiia bacterium]
MNVVDGEFVLRAASSDDLLLVKKTLYTALSWNPLDPVPAFEVVVSHPKIAIYHEGWMRDGDDGVVAETKDGVFVGMAFCRLFTNSDEAQGFVDGQTPELAVGVEAEFRGRGVGRRLLERLRESRAAADVERMSLSVDADNRALQLYETLGYTEERRHGDGIVMIATLIPVP